MTEQDKVKYESGVHINPFCNGDNAILKIGEEYFVGWIETRLDYNNGNVENLYFCRKTHFPIPLTKANQYGQLIKAL